MADELNSRVMKVMQHYDLSPSIFADEIGISRSKMSHIVNGRNKPSIEVLQHILTRYTELSSEWLLTGKGELLNTELAEQKEALTPASPIVNAPDAPTAEERSSAGEKTEPDTAISVDKQIKRITVYYRDGTFEDFYAER